MRSPSVLGGAALLALAGSILDASCQSAYGRSGNSDTRATLSSLSRDFSVHVVSSHRAANHSAGRTLLSAGVPIVNATPTRAHGATYSPIITGSVKGFRLAGIEPDGDPLNQVVLQTRLTASARTPAMNLIVNSYLENFKPDTTPILPDLLNPRQTARNLGGFLQGKSLLTDDAGNVLFIGSFLAEAFITDNSNHAVMHLYGSGAAYRGSARLKGIFQLRPDGSLRGILHGRIDLPAAARHQLATRRGAAMKPLKQIIDVVTVKPAAMMGRSSTRSQTVPLRTGYPNSGNPASPSIHAHPSRGASLFTIAAAIGAVVSLLIGVYLFWSDRRQARRAA